MSSQVQDSAPAVEETHEQSSVLSQAATTVLVPSGLVAVLGVVGYQLPSGISRAALILVVLTVVVAGLHLFSGLSGVLSFGHIAFMAFGAYGSAILTVPPQMKATQFPGLPGVLADHQLATLPAALVVAVVGGLLAYVIGLALMRLSGLAASLATFALLVIVYVVIGQWESVTGGLQNVVGVPQDTTLLLAIAAMFVGVLLVFGYQSTGHGLRLKASREDYFAAEALGVDVKAERRLAFALSAGLVAFGGALYGHVLGTFSPDTFYLDVTFITIAMLILGGLGSLAGALIGTAAISVAIEILRAMERGATFGTTNVALPGGSVEIILGLLILGVLILRPGGITGGREIVSLRRPSSNRRTRT